MPNSTSVAFKNATKTKKNKKNTQTLLPKNGNNNTGYNTRPLVETKKGGKRKSVTRRNNRKQRK